MPRRPACGSDDIIKDISAAKKQIITGQNIAVPSEKMWIVLSQQLNNKVSPKNLYTFVKTNRHNILQILKLCKNDTHIQDKDPSSDRLQESSRFSDTNQQCQCYDIQFEMSLSHQRWKVVYNDKSLNTCKREYTILKHGAWAHILYEEIWKNIKTSCTHKIHERIFFPTVASHCIDIIGHCTECDTQLSIIAENIPAANKQVVLKCMIRNVDSLHTGKAKRKLSGALRTHVSKELWEGWKPAHVWRAAEAYKMMDVGDTGPSHLPNLATLRKIQQEMGDKKLGDKNPIMSLHLINYSVLHNGSIHDIETMIFAITGPHLRCKFIKWNQVLWLHCEFWCNRDNCEKTDKTLWQFWAYLPLPWSFVFTGRLCSSSEALHQFYCKLAHRMVMSKCCCAQRSSLWFLLGFAWSIG